MSDFTSILPSNSSSLEVSIENAIVAAQPDLGGIPKLMLPDACPQDLLPWLAWAMSVDFWNDGWSSEDKRQVVSESIGVHRVKGTIGSVKRALAAAGYGDAQVVEHYGWDFYNGASLYDGSITFAAPDHWAEYRVYLSRPITIDQASIVSAILADVAPARCHLKGLYFTQAANLHNAAINYDGSYTHGVV